MATPQRLPIVNSDDGVWGDIIRQFLMKEHYNDDTDNAVNGGHQNVTIRAGTTTAAPLTFANGSLLTTAAEGAVEFSGQNLYFTTRNGALKTRQAVGLFSTVSSASGDMYYRDSGTSLLQRLPIGTSGQILQAQASGSPAWADASSGFASSTKTSSYTMTATDTVVFADATSGNVTITLPAASGLAGYRFYVKRIDNSANTVTIGRTGTDTIDGQTSHTLDLQYTAAAFVSNGSNWYIL